MNMLAGCGYKSDERRTGGDGSLFDFHAHDDSHFCIVSDSDLHINAHFTGRQSPSAAAKTRNSSWIHAIAVLFGEHRVYVGTRNTNTRDDGNDHLEISFEGVHVQLPEADSVEWKPRHVPELKISRLSAVNTMKIELKGRFKIIANAVPVRPDDDLLVHLDLHFKFDALMSDVHGMVGQTYRPDYAYKSGEHKNLLMLLGSGGGDDFSTSSLFAADCTVARFGRSDGEADHLADVKCTSGMVGTEIVCKK